MDAFSRFKNILNPTCLACGHALTLRDEDCPACGAALDDGDEMLDVVIDDGVPRLAVATEQNNLGRLLSALSAWERGEMTADAVRATATPVVELFAAWRADMEALDPADMETDIEREMHDWYKPLAISMSTLLDAYALAAERNDPVAARHFVNSLAEGFFVLKELLARYAT